VEPNFTAAEHLCCKHGQLLRKLSLHSGRAPALLLLMLLPLVARMRRMMMRIVRGNTVVAPAGDYN